MSEAARASLMQRLVRWARRQRARERARRLFRASGLFDAAWYLKANPDVAAKRVDPVDHFLTSGASEGRRPHPAFDTAWYLERNPDVAASHQNPLVHFILSGAPEGRDPNPYFSTRWYRTNNPGAEAAPTPLSHYVREGAAQLRDPSPKFDARWYAQTNPDAAASGLDPLSHFLTVGRAQGRRPSPFGEEVFRGDPVEDARLTAFLPLQPMVGETVALLVAHAPDGALKPNVGPYVAALADAGVKVVLIAAADRPFTPDPAVNARLAGGFVRENRGYDFAAWAHVLRAEPSLYAASTLILTNDSIIGPMTQAGLEDLLERVRRSPADLVGATDSREQTWHLQSYFLALKERVLSSYALHRFFDGVRSLGEKDHVIRAYELTLTARMQAAGFDAEAAFESRDDVNATVFHWRELLADGFPFAKTLTLRGAFEGVDVAGWRETLAQAGFDPEVAAATVDTPTTPSAPPPKDWPLLAAPAAPPLPAPPYKVAFIGPWNYASGLGVAGRGYLSALWRCGFRLNVHPIERPFPPHTRTAPTVSAMEFDGPADVAVVHLNPDAWATLLTDAQRRIVERARTRIGVFVWEMEQAPETWKPVLDQLDAVWVPSRYCAEAVRRATRAPVHVVPHVVPVGAPPLPGDRAAVLKGLGLPEDARVVLYAFDGSSYLTRKNPEALVRAFATAGLAAHGWRLVLKTKHLSAHKRQADALAELVEATAGVTLIDRPLPRKAQEALFDAADIYASPHRSEGFGLTIAEAMAKGKLVVATDYGGSRDFLDATCGFPVPAQPAILARASGHYFKGGAWAEPDEAALAEALKAAAAEVASGEATLGLAARARVAERLSPEAVAHAIREGVEAVLRPAQEAAA